MNEVEFKSFGEKLDTLLGKVQALFTRIPSNNLVLKDKDGKEFKLEKESGECAIGDKASPDGTYVMADGRTIVVTNGVVASIAEPVAAKTELEIANEKIATLEAKVDAMEKEKPDLVAAEAAFKAKETEVMGIVTELTNLRNKWVPEARSKSGGGTENKGIDLARVKEINEKLNPKEK